ncbi:MAG: Na+/H+ antiporter NhaD/arsenite permease-like protein, partial [Arenicella sp.]
MSVGVVMIIIFVVGYVAIALEHNIKVDKAASALLIGMICWGMYAVWPEENLGVTEGQTIENIANDSTIRANNPAFHKFAKEEYVKENDQLWIDEVLHDGEDKIERTTKDPYATSHHIHEYVEHGLMHHLYEIAGILFFLLGAMTIVELIDAHEGFSVITDRINTTSKVKLLWVICLLTFFMSAALDNLTTSIVMISVIRKLIDSKESR